MGYWIMLSNDIVKIKYSNEGYLPNFPPHLISDEEMCEAFIQCETFEYFRQTYKLVNIDLLEDYYRLIRALRYHICRFVSKIEGWHVDELPEWVYSYMLGEVINNNSDQRDKHYLLTGIGMDNIDDEITSDIQKRCLEVSKHHVDSLTKDKKFFRLSDLEETYKDDKDKLEKILIDLKRWHIDFSVEFKLNSDEGEDGVNYRDGVDTEGVTDEERAANRYIHIRPPSMFGEPHIIKYIRKQYSLYV